MEAASPILDSELISETPVPVLERKLFIFALLVTIILLAGSICIWFSRFDIRQNQLNYTGILTPTPNEAKVVEQVLATLPPENPQILYTIVSDPENLTVAYTIDAYTDTASGSSTVVFNNRAEKKYPQTSDLIVSPDGKHAAYIVTDGNKQFVVWDGAEGKRYDYIKNLKFSPDSHHVAYAAGDNKHLVPDGRFVAFDETSTFFIVVDTAEGKKYDGYYAGTNLPDNYDPFFSWDGTKVTYGAIKSGKNIVVDDTQELSGYISQQYPKFIGNSYDIAYIAYDGKRAFAVVADQKQSPHDYIGTAYTDRPMIYVGKDASQIAYEANDNNISSVIANDMSYPISGALSNLVFSKSGKYVAYFLGSELFINGKDISISPPFINPLVGDLVISPDEKVLAYSMSDQVNHSVLIRLYATETSKSYYFRLPDYKGTGALKFSSDSGSIYFKAVKNRNIIFVTLNVNQIMK